MAPRPFIALGHFMGNLRLPSALERDGDVQSHLHPVHGHLLKKRPHFYSAVLEVFHFFLRKPSLKCCVFSWVLRTVPESAVRSQEF